MTSDSPNELGKPEKRRQKDSVLSFLPNFGEL